MWCFLITHAKFLVWEFLSNCILSNSVLLLGYCVLEWYASDFGADEAELLRWVCLLLP